jgi:hypothetical protein
MAKGTTATEAKAATVIGTFEGKDIRRTSVEIPGVAGGLQKAMKIDPRVMKQGERGYIALEYVVEKIRHDPIDKDAPAGDQERVHIFQVEGSAFVDGTLVKQSVEEQKDKLRKLDDERKGRTQLPDAGTITVGAKKAPAKKAAAKKKAAPAKASARGRRTPAK